VNDISKVRSYRKKQYFFLKLDLEESSMDFRFTSSALCKEWVGYLMQAMTYNRYLNDRKAFSRSDSFTRFVNDLRENEKLRIVTLEEGQTGSVYEELPEEKTMVRESKRRYHSTQALSNWLSSKSPAKSEAVASLLCFWRSEDTVSSH
jgi:hypothetical protein